MTNLKHVSAAELSGAAEINLRPDSAFQLSADGAGIIEGGEERFAS